MRLSFSSRKAATAPRGIGGSVHTAIDEFADAARPAVDRAAATAHDAVDTALSAAEGAADWLGQRSDSAQATRRRLVAKTTQYVAAHPLKTAALFFLAGVIFARLMR